MVSRTVETHRDEKWIYGNTEWFESETKEWYTNFYSPWIRLTDAYHAKVTSGKQII